MTDRALIICAGDATRWGNYTGVPKHLVEIEGERLLDRTCRQLWERDHNIITKVVVKNTTPSEYDTMWSEREVADLHPEYGNMDKFLSSKSLWSKDGRTIVLYGDVWFSDFAMDTIMDFKGRGMWLFCRPSRSHYTGCEWGECFAQSFYPENLEDHERILHECSADSRFSSGGWGWYRKMAGIDASETVLGGNAVTIDDFTEDFDFPKDLDMWLKNRAEKQE